MDETQRAKGRGAGTGGVGAFGALLRRHRGAAGLSQEALAERAGLSLRGVSDLERGARRAPHAATVERLADALGLTGGAREALGAAARGAPGTAPAAVPVGAPRPLPVPPTSFVGREEAVAAVCRLLALEPGAPSGGPCLVTLTGPGGIGKTRLALAVAGGADGEVAFADLAPLADPDLVPGAVAAALGAQEASGRPLPEALARAIGGRSLLLVLDNCEHVVGAAADVAASLLAACPALRVLATSREPLEVAGEAVWPVPALGLPDDPPGGPSGDHRAVPPDGAGLAGAVRLFVERAAAAAPGFTLAAEDAGAVAEVCRRLDGLPLAIELAAARVRGLGMAGLAARLDARLDLLAAGRRGGPARQQTLRATLDWSYDLLEPAEQALLARLSVFAGGFDLPAAQAVASGAGDPEGAPEVVPTQLARLVDRSLVVPGEADGGRRYRLLETVREYAAERLADEGHAAAAAVRRRHAEHYATLAERAATGLWGPDQAAWLARLDAELGNVRAALAWVATAGGAGANDTGLRLAGALWRFWGRRGRAGEGRAHLERLLAGGAGGAGAPAVRARGLFADSYLAWRQGDLGAARARGLAALALAEAAGDVQTTLWARQGLGGTALAAGDAAGAEAVLADGLVRARAAGEPVAVSWCLYFLGEASRTRGDLRRAARRLGASVAGMRARGDDWSAGLVLLGLARVVATGGEPARAAALQRESLACWRTLGDAVGVAHALDELAQVALAGGQAPRAARLFGAAAALRERAGGAAWPPWQADRDRALTAARGALGEAPFGAAWAAGQALGLEAALAEAEGVASGPRTPAARLHRKPHRGPRRPPRDARRASGPEEGPPGRA